MTTHGDQFANHEPHNANTTLTAAPTPVAFDPTALEVSHIPLGHIPRGWERFPRTAPSKTLSSHNTHSTRPWQRPRHVSRTTRNRVANASRRWNASSPSPRVAVKKLRLADSFGIGAKVSQWESHGSPVRRIVTRSNNATNEELIALPDEEADPKQQQTTVEEEEVPGTILEIVDEQGRVMSADGEPEERWEDERPARDGTGEHDGTNTNTEAHVQTTLPLFQNLPSDCVLPEGFVSPVKMGVRRKARLSWQGARAKRKSLPAAFAPAADLAESSSSSANASSSEEAQSERAAVENWGLHDLESKNIAESVISDASVPVTGRYSTEVEGEGVWEDIDEEDDLIDDSRPCNVHAQAGEKEVETGERTPDRTADAKSEDSCPRVDSPTNNDEEMEDLLQDLTGGPALDILSSPVKLVMAENESVNLPLRRSPRRLSRRASASPTKNRISTERPAESHLIAFSPIKRSHYDLHQTRQDHELDVLLSPNEHPSNVSYQDGREETTSAAAEKESLAGIGNGQTMQEFVASASFPDRAMQQERAYKPRISDDTALIQAFLNRAAESKSLRGTDSGLTDMTSRTSPEPTRVLADLDPNSPSPRRLTKDDDIDTNEESASRSRSTRVRKKPESLIAESHQVVPNKITIRSKMTGVELQRTEAQEMAMITRNNTRRNKGQSLPPTMLLGVMGQMAVDEPGVAKSSVGPTSARRSVRWAETLTSFSPCVPLTDQVIETASDGKKVEQATTTEEVPSIVETLPDGPKVASLELSQDAPILEPIERQEETVESTPAPVKKRKSRIATPAKGLKATSLLPDIVTAEAKPGISRAAPAAGRRPVSKLPAPTSYVLGQGKENAVTLSPAKRPVKALFESRLAAPKLDLSAASQDIFQANKITTTSPTRKSTRKRSDEGPVNRRISSIGGAMGGSGLMSPAKRRTRRAA